MLRILIALEVNEYEDALSLAGDFLFPYERHDVKYLARTTDFSNVDFTNPVNNV